MQGKRRLADLVEIGANGCMRAIITAVINQTAKNLDAGAPRLANEEAARIIAWLKQAVTAEHKDAAHMAKDKDLDALRGREDFKKLLSAAGKPHHVLSAASDTQMSSLSFRTYMQRPA